MLEVVSDLDFWDLPVLRLSPFYIVQIQPGSVGACSAAGSASFSRARSPEFDTPFVSPSTDLRRAVFSYWQRYVKLVLIYRLGIVW